MQDKNIILFGKNGQIGSAIVDERPDIKAFDREDVDISSEDALADFLGVLAKSPPQVIINASAYTDVERAEDEGELAHRINAQSVGQIARFCAQHGALLVHYSTDYVFDGKQGDYREDDAPAPLGVYAASKLAGEEAVRESGCAHLILRVSGVYKHGHRNFVSTMVRLMGEREQLKIVGDQVVSPCYAPDIARATLDMIGRVDADMRETYHMTPREPLSWCEFARMIERAARQSGEGLQLREILEISSSEYPTKAQRPLDGSLCCDKILRDFGVDLPGHEDALRRYFSNKDT